MTHQHPLLSDLHWLDQLREYYTAQLIGHMLADPPKATALYLESFKPQGLHGVFAPELPLTLDQKEFAKAINYLVVTGTPPTRRAVADVLYQPRIDQYTAAKKAGEDIPNLSKIWVFWPDNVECPLEPWDKVLQDVSVLIYVIGVHDYLDDASDALRALQIAPALGKLKQAVALLGMYRNL